MPYVYTLTGDPVPTGVQVYQIPPGVADKYPLGGWFTGDGQQVTKVLGEEEGFPLAPTQDSSAFTKVDLIQELRDQLNRIEAKLGA